jgi:alpha-beta hydrolase superfamily lysophospholipase
VTHLVLKDELLDAQTLRAVAAAQYGGADIGECLATARRVRGTDLDGWHDEWRRTADAVTALAEDAEAAGRRETARRAHLRACTYYRTAGVMLMGAPIDPRLVETYALQRTAFRRAAALMEHPPEILEIPFEGGALPGYFFRVDDDPRPRATVVATNGYDGTAEELYFWNVAAALERGYNALAFDGPGQGAMLTERGITMRPDWENVVTPVMDHLLEREDVDPDRVALIGLSLGAHLAPRAASGEHRLAACIADCGAYDMGAMALARLPGPLREGFEEGRRVPVATVRAMLDEVMKKPTAGWALRRGLLVHGVTDPAELIEAIRDYTLVGRAERIRCPTWVCNAEGDDISASAPQLVEALTCEKELVTFTAAEGADDHCETAARQLYHARAFGWLDDRLRPLDA